MIGLRTSAVGVVRVLVTGVISMALPVFSADDALAVWAYGDGALDGEATPISRVVHPGQLVEAGTGPVRLELIGFAGSDVILASGAAARFSLETTASQTAPTLVVQVEHGALAIDVTGSGPYAAVITRGGALESRATGAEFILERRDDLDYVALAKGLLLVRLRAGLAAADGMTIQLQARQGLAGSDKGLSEVDQLDRRPQLQRPLPIQAQATDSSTSESDWSLDEAALATGDSSDDEVAITRAPETAVLPVESGQAKMAPDPRTQPVPDVSVASEVAPVAPVADLAPAVPVATASAENVVAKAAAPMAAADLRAAAGARGAAVFLR